MSDYEISEIIFKGLHLNLTGDNLKNYVLEKSGCDLETFLELYQSIVAAWAQ